MQLSFLDEEKSSQTTIQNVTDENERTYKGMKPTKNVQKPLVIPVDKSFLQGSLIEIPFITYYKTKNPITTVEYVWVDSNHVERKVEVRGSKWGVPDEFCYDVIIALFGIYTKTNNVIVKQEDGKFNMPKSINFTFLELAKEMGYKSVDSRLYNKLDIALEILNDTNIYNKSNVDLFGIDENDTEIHNIEMKESIGIIKNYRSYRYSTRKEGEKRLNSKLIKEYTSVVLDDYIFESLKKAYFKIYDKCYMKDLKGISKKLFLLLNKWRAKRNKASYKWETLYQRIPLDDTKSEYYRKRRIREACKQLVESGYIDDYHENIMGVEFIFENQDVDKKFNTLNEILTFLFDIGLYNNEITQLTNSVDISKLQSILRKINDKPSEKQKEELLKLING